MVEKQEELEKLEAQKHKILKDKEDVEMDTMREGFRNVLKSKFFNEWRSVKQTRLIKEKGDPKAKIDQK